jgi:hypothetical protein
MERSSFLTLDDILWMRSIAEARVRSLLRSPIVDVTTRRKKSGPAQPVVSSRSWVPKMFKRSNKLAAVAPGAPSRLLSLLQPLMSLVFLLGGL